VIRECSAKRFLGTFDGSLDTWTERERKGATPDKRQL
jgi:hypothetical protein